MATHFLKMNEGWNAEPNSPNPQIECSGATVLLSFSMNAFEYPEFNEEDIGQLTFTNCWRYRLGSTNDEGWWKGQCRFSKLAPKWGQFYEITGDVLLSKGPRDWKAIGRARDDARHFLFYFRDSTFECSADGWEMKVIKSNGS